MSLLNRKLTLLVLLALLAITSASYGQTFGSGSLTTSDLTYHPAIASTLGSGMQFYDLYQLTVTATGTYVFELSSRNTTGTPSNALDTLFTFYATTFNPLAPGAGISSNDDFTGTFTVLPGPFAGSGYTTTSTGFQGTQPGSRSATISLSLGTNYFLAVSSFRDTTFVGTGTTAQPKGDYVFGINGPGTVVIVPEPTTMALLAVMGAGALGVRAWRKRKAA